MSTASKPAFGDLIQPFQIETLGLRGRLVRLSDAFSSSLKAHNYPPSVSALLGETMALSATLSSALKFEGIFTLQTRGDGPVTILMSDITSDGNIRAYAQFDADKLSVADKQQGEIVPRYLGAGHLAFTVDQGTDMERYQGISELLGANLSECAQTYFKTSEQLETAIIAVSSTEGNQYKSAALMIQRLPASEEGSAARDEDDENWRRSVVLMSSIRKEELLDETLQPSDILYRLYHEDGVRLFDQKPVQHNCRCSKEKVETTLKSFPVIEVKDMVEDDGSISVTCEFCSTEYRFDEKQLDDLLTKQT